MTRSPSGGWREVYRWCLVEDDQHDLVDDLGESTGASQIDDAQQDVQNNVIRRGRG